ncbi:MAG TPA: hypothetical protein VGZ26_02210 [Pirellulales bacterium]|jgi:hypothetical protein|nr:hypothetical protein [Pirellulales bacterium]
MHSLDVKGIAMMTGISEAKLTGPDRIDVKLYDGYTVTESLPVTIRDFLHFGYFLLALRSAMDGGMLASHKIDHDRLRESWEPRREVLEMKLCNQGP